MPRPLGERIAIVTGVGRRAGIGFAIARRLLGDGARVIIQSWSAYDAEQPSGADPGGAAAVVQALGGQSGTLRHEEMDLAEPEAASRLVEAAVDQYGQVDVLVVNHTRTSGQSLQTLTADELDRSWAVNVRASLLLVQAFAEAHDDARPGRVVLFTSGQHRAPMSHGLPYAVTKGAIHQMTLSLSDALADRGITVNAVNPGPTDTGWAGPELFAELERRFPAGRWGAPDDAANLVAWLASDEAGWINGQVIDSEGGFRRWSGAT